MPLLTSFYGIILTMNFTDHNPPHFHARFAEFKALFDFDGEMFEGAMPDNKKVLIKAWAILHKDELNANWILASSNESIIKIEPLR